MSPSPTEMNSLISRLEIPPEISRLGGISEASTLAQLELWKEGVTETLQEILHLLRCQDETLPLEDQGNLIFRSVPFISTSFLESFSSEDAEVVLENEWSSTEAQLVAKDLLHFSMYSSPSRELITQVLTQNLRPIFKSSPHPQLHSETGRKLARSAGGSMAMQDYYEGQRWKEYPGIAHVVLWCVHGIEKDAYETMWHLFIPPLMALLDDYEARHKWEGVMVVRELLRRVPPDLLKRTGIDGLLSTSLRTSLSHLQSQETPILLKSAIYACIELALLTTSSTSTSRPSSERFDQLCSLLGEGIIAGIWLYAEDKPAVIAATFETLPTLLKALGVGSTRFLQALVPQLTHVLIPRPLVDQHTELQLFAVKALATLIDTCKPRVNPWKETILDAVGRCWVGIIDDERKADKINAPGDIQERVRLKNALQSLCKTLADICPSVRQQEYQKLLAVDTAMFQELCAI